MWSAARNGICVVVALAVLRPATAGQANKGSNQALRIQPMASKVAESPTKDMTPAVNKEATPSTTKDDESPSKAKNSSSMDSLIPVFKMPTYHHVDSLSAATNGFLDWFVVGYWGVIVVFIVGVDLLHGHLPEVFSAPATEPKDCLPESPEDPVEAPAERQTSLKRRVSYLAGDEISALDVVGEPEDKSLAPNVFSLMLIAACGEARDKKRNILSPKLVFVAGLAMGLIQFLTLFLVVYDIDPGASPYTVKPASPWKSSPLTVNTMKVVMTFFLGMYVVSEAADAYDNFILGMAMKSKDLLIHRWTVLFIPIFHYLITLSVILAGVSVVLSCQDVPDILYNSMAILFITRVDELFWGFFERMFDIEAAWNVKINESDVAEIQTIKKCIIMFPMLWGFCLLGRAWYRDQMPALVVRVIASGSVS